MYRELLILKFETDIGLNLGVGVKPNKREMHEQHDDKTAPQRRLAENFLVGLYPRHLLRGNPHRRHDPLCGFFSAFRQPRPSTFYLMYPDSEYKYLLIKQ